MQGVGRQVLFSLSLPPPVVYLVPRYHANIMNDHYQLLFLILIKYYHSYKLIDLRRPVIDRQCLFA